ncbi:hypothetical protein BRC60_08635 [Halobacteriales archaeon QH_1_68_42]|nr:MAG: hypothetical protein BRC60_08635 [Halobacteriales archaeon QH_1_68_42]
MCTLVFAWQVFPDAPVVAAANRDELLDRPSEPPSVIEEEPGVVAPRDAEAGGTWIGDERGYEGFNLVLADARAALYVEYDGATRVRNFDPGVHVVVNVGADGDYTVPAERQAAGEQQAQNADGVAAALAPEPGETSSSWLDRAAGVVSDHEFGVCVHRDRFGTRSSSLITIGRKGTTYRYADGPPCETAYRRVESQV